MNLATVPATNALVAVTELLSGGSLILYNGTQPATPETALSGNTPLATFVFQTPAFATPSFASSNEKQTAAFAASSVQPGANGTVTFARATMLTSAWAISTTYAVGKIVTNSSNLYYCIASGTTGSNGTSLGSGSGPTGTTISGGPSGVIVDSTVYWIYLGGSTGTVVADFTVGLSGASPDIVIGNVTLSTTINVTITSFVLQIPAS